MRNNADRIDYWKYYNNKIKFKVKGKLLCI